ncbi:TetR/AcrR family transcriptional regulator [Mycolicibacterium diernhoferi]|uniref:TetR family transcriptional regulator n=1 Tax=Mycolicibacterium diernhoferi TaxID=1801 RepID=A0A1Q4HHJ4_9MYCO|nr:TetR/AcrR family transcriptional regulator [Mycolicibacterium diernhoferi]OJZ67019.1 TetR family transcriptional regulator [Mycolicibacterium diernhoferi]OPE56205.1 TetR family transcriptional regulator [Mycolicibacterium diernhoferi]PEG52523.1 TetR/AcrR family transcriptional regulator [Mycolicibacterium diernhoferi]QYL23212.1 TetR/AcrR family transcriptional regulator [Mycolicibacterium diernhoferi]
MVAEIEDRLLAVVVEILETEGYDAVQLREVARRARTSLATIYKRYSTREDLILAALEAWQDEHRYSAVNLRSRAAGESLHSALMALFRTIFEPWEHNPGMLTAYFRARSSPRGQQLFRRGVDIVAPAGLELMADVDGEFVADLNNVVSSVVYGLLGRFVAGEITNTEILPTLDRTVYWLTAGYEATKRTAAE